MTLLAFIKKFHSGSQASFAEAAGIDKGQLSKYLRAERGEPGGSRPGADNIARIEKATGGKITALHWSKLRAPRPDRDPDIANQPA